MMIIESYVFQCQERKKVGGFNSGNSELINTTGQLI